MTLAEWLARVMRGRGWSQRQLAAQLEVSPQTVGDILGGHIPRDVILQKIADVLGTDMAYLHQLAGYSWREAPGIKGEATRLARLLENYELIREFWQELESANPSQIEQTLDYLRFLKSS